VVVLRAAHLRIVRSTCVSQAHPSTE
jgi:hypothetical protein